MSFKELAVKAKAFAVKGYGFGKEVHRTAKAELARAREDSRINRTIRQELEIKNLEKKKAELHRLRKIQSLKKELGMHKQKDFFDAGFKF